MKKIMLFILLWSLSGTVIAANCDLVYDEFESLMNKEFLLHPEKFVPVKSKKLSRQDYNKLQKNKFLLSRLNKGLGIAVVHTNKNTWGKLLYFWGKPYQNGQPTLIIKKLVLFGRVKDGHKPRVMRNLIIKSSYSLDLDTGKSDRKNADIWFHNVNGKEMYIEAINGATLKFPTRSLCKPKLPANNMTATMLKPLKPVISTAVNSQPQSNSKQVVKRAILANGHVVISYTNGSKIERFKGGFKNILPDGSESMVLFSTAAPAAFPVEPPEGEEYFWLESHRKNLLHIIESLVDDPDLVQQFVENVDVTDNLYQSIETRSDTIQKLVSP